MLNSRSEGRKVEPPRDTFVEDFGNLYTVFITVITITLGMRQSLKIYGKRQRNMAGVAR